VIVQSKFEKNGETPTDVIQLIEDTFSIQLLRSVTNQKRIRATCFIDSPLVNLKLLLYFIYQNQPFQRYLFVEESRVIDAEKTFMYFTFYPNPRNTKRFVTFTLRNVHSDEAKHVDCKLPKAEDPDQTFLLLNVRHCENDTDMKETIHMMSVLIRQYKEKESELYAFFKRSGIIVPETNRVKVKESKEDFNALLMPFANDLGPEYMNFALYWTEKNNKGKERWECEKFFDISRRVKTWMINNSKFKNNGATNNETKLGTSAARMEAIKKW
jgi:hypothetical protein